MKISVALFTILALTTSQAAAAAPRAVGTRPQLLLDSRVVDATKNIRMTMHSPRRDGRVLLTNDRPWENRDSSLVAVYSSILRDQGKFRIWYDLGDRKERSRRVVAYAESTDGIHFTKPLPTKLGFSTKRLLCYQRVWTNRTCMNFFICQMMQL